MRVPIFLIAFILFTALLAVKRKKSTEAQENANEAFLERERMANATRKKDISALPYLSFSTDTLPVGEFADDELYSCETVLQNLTDQKIINLSMYTNTDLKLMYGPANLADLSSYDENYHLLTTTLLAYARREVELDRIDAAVTILEYAMSLALDVSQICCLQSYIKNRTHRKRSRTLPMHFLSWTNRFLPWYCRNFRFPILCNDLICQS